MPQASLPEGAQALLTNIYSVSEHPFQSDIFLYSADGMQLCGGW